VNKSRAILAVAVGLAILILIASATYILQRQPKPEPLHLRFACGRSGEYSNTYLFEVKDDALEVTKGTRGYDIMASSYLGPPNVEKLISRPLTKNELSGLTALADAVAGCEPVFSFGDRGESFTNAKGQTLIVFDGESYFYMVNNTRYGFYTYYEKPSDMPLLDLSDRLIALSGLSLPDILLRDRSILSNYFTWHTMLDEYPEQLKAMLERNPELLQAILDEHPDLSQKLSDLMLLTSPPG
jgi:hypothetical protein